MRMYRRVPYVLFLKRAVGFLFTLKITKKKFSRENAISLNIAFPVDLIADSDSAEFSKEFGLFEFLCSALLIEIFSSGGTEYCKNHFFDVKLQLNLISLVGYHHISFCPNFSGELENQKQI